MSARRTPWDLDDARRMLRRAHKAAEREIAKLERDETTWDKVVRKIDRVDDLRSWLAGRDEVPEAERTRWSAVSSDLRSAMVDAHDRARQARSARNNEEIARLQREARAARPAPGTFEAELAVMRRGRS